MPTIDLILLEDEPVIAEELGEFLAECGYRVTLAQDCASFVERFEVQRHHLAVMDLGLPDGDGLDLIGQLREQGSTLGIVAFTARGATPQRVAGLRMGADHYLSKGVDLDELAAVLAALCRRLGLQDEPACWVLQRALYRLQAPNQQSLALSYQDMRVLDCLLRRAGDSVSRREIVEALGEDYLHYDQRRLDTQIHRLRRHVEQATGLALPLKTLRNSGYCFYERVQLAD